MTKYRLIRMVILLAAAVSLGLSGANVSAQVVEGPLPVIEFLGEGPGSFTVEEGRFFVVKTYENGVSSLRGGRANIRAGRAAVWTRYSRREHRCTRRPQLAPAGVRSISSMGTLIRRNRFFHGECTDRLRAWFSAVHRSGGASACCRDGGLSSACRCTRLRADAHAGTADHLRTSSGTRATARR